MNPTPPTPSWFHVMIPPPPLNEVYAPLRDCMICGGELHAPLRVHIMSTPLNDGSLAWSVWVSPLPPFESMSYLRPWTVVPLHDLCWWALCPLWVHVISTPLNGGSLAWSVLVSSMSPLSPCHIYAPERWLPCMICLGENYKFIT